jgi:purine-binding chemotaxis protein CheW
MAPQTKSTDILQLVTFRLGEEEYGLDILKIQEVNRWSAVTAMPNTPHYFDGVINLRGRVIPVVNLRKMFGMPFDHAEDCRIMVVNACGKTVGLIVDAVSEVLRIPANTIETPPDLGVRTSNAYVTGIGKLENRLLLLIDIELLLADSIQSTVALIEESAETCCAIS